MTPHRLLMVDLSGHQLSADERAFLKEYKVGGICLFRRNFTDRAQTAELTDELRDILGQDLLIATDQEGGGVVRALDVPYSPGTMLLGAADDPDLTRQVAAATARGLRALGLNLNFAPDADVNNNPLNPVIGDRSFGSDPQQVAKHVVAFVQGMQAEGIAATVKHFPGHGDTATDSHLDLPRLEVARERLETVELVPFRAALAAGVACVMSYHGVATALEPDEMPSTLSRRVMTTFLRDDLGFDGVSFTDALEMQAIADRHSPTEAVVRALLAGIDMPIYDVHTGPVSTHEKILQGIDEALSAGRLNPREVERKLERIRRLARRYPSSSHPEAAWTEGDEELLNQASRKAVTVWGDFRPLKPGSSLTVVAASNQVGGAASDRVESPAQMLAELLSDQGFEVTKAFYDRDDIAETRASILEKVAKGGTVLFVSTSRTRMGEAEKSFALEVAAKASNFLHVALWNPYHVLDLPQPALISFGFRESSVQAVLEVLTGGEVLGKLPIDLKV